MSNALREQVVWRNTTVGDTPVELKINGLFRYALNGLSNYVFSGNLIAHDVNDVTVRATWWVRIVGRQVVTPDSTVIELASCTMDPSSHGSFTEGHFAPVADVATGEIVPMFTGPDGRDWSIALCTDVDQLQL